MIKHVIFIFCILIGFASQAQDTIIVSDVDFDALGQGNCNCAVDFASTTDPNFMDTGRDTADYGANENEVISFCPDLTGTKVTFTLLANGIDGSDTLYIYDGPDELSPLLGAYNDDNIVAGLAHTASLANASGCLTIKFLSDGTTEGSGWEAAISCGNIIQPFEAHMEAYINGEANGANDNFDDLSEPDTGFVDICLGDSIMFVATPDFMYDPTSGNTNGGGYDQIGDHVSKWNFSNGTVQFGDTIWFKPTTISGFFVDLSITDAMTLQERVQCKVRVSDIPSFAGVFPLEDSICSGEEVQIMGGGSQATGFYGVGVGDTVEFSINGSFSETTFLPDADPPGSFYETSIDISGFPIGSTIQNASEIEKICIKIEHSWLGDLEMLLTCPNGQQAVVFNSFQSNPGIEMIPGGWSGDVVGGQIIGDGHYLGGANDAGSTVGVCEEYCFTDAVTALPSWNNGYNTVAASGPSTGNMVEPGSYNPEESFFTELQGCPANGDWIITVVDNLNSDDGWICEWGVFLNLDLGNNIDPYNADLITSIWDSGPFITSVNDSSIFAAPIVVGPNEYTLVTENSFGCTFDTIVTVEVYPFPSVMNDTMLCLGETVFMTGTTSPLDLGGVWSATGPGTVDFQNDPTDLNPEVFPHEAGDYTLTYTGNLCGNTDDLALTVNSYPWVSIALDKDTVCVDDEYTVYAVGTHADSFLWNTGETSDSINLVASVPYIVDAENLFSVEVFNICGSHKDEFYLFIQDCKVPNVMTPNGDGENDFFLTEQAKYYDDVELVIYNRWGKVVYKTDSYDNTWSGERNNSNTKITSGTYYYIMNWNGGMENESGTITLFDSK